MKRILYAITLIAFTLALAGCEDKISTGMYAGYCWNSWTGEHYWCGD